MVCSCYYCIISYQNHFEQALVSCIRAQVKVKNSKSLYYVMMTFSFHDVFTVIFAQVVKLMMLKFIRLP